MLERLEDAAMRTVFGPTTSPEEGFAKKYKTWANSSVKTTENVTTATLKNFPPFTMVENRKKHRQNSHPIIHCPMSEGVSKVSEQANK